MQTPHLFTTSALFEKTKAILSELKEKNPQIKTALDAPAGAGALSKYLKEDLKLEVQALDIDASKWQYPAVSITAADLGRKLPIGDQSMDLVVCLEGLKHVTDISTAVSELARVLKPGGFFLLTIPNDLCMQTRIRYLFDGFVDTDWHHPLDVKADEAHNYLYVNSLTSLPYLYYFLEKNRLHLVKTYASRMRFLSILLGIIFYPLVVYFTKKSCPKNHPLINELTSFTWLAGRHNLILARKGLS